MKFKCPVCKTILEKDMRMTENKGNMSKKGYPSYCVKAEKKVYCKIIK